MAEGIDDFTIVLPEWTDMAACELKVYDGLDRLWRMVERKSASTLLPSTPLMAGKTCASATRSWRWENRAGRSVRGSTRVPADAGTNVREPRDARTSGQPTAGEQASRLAEVKGAGRYSWPSLSAISQNARR